MNDREDLLKPTEFMFCKSFLPSPVLQDFIRNYKILHLKFNIDQPIPFKHRPPKPEQGLVFYLKGSVNLQNLNTGTSQTPAPISIFSHQTDKTRFNITSEFFILTVFFRPGVLHRLIGIPMNELIQNYLDAELIFGMDIKSLTDELLEKADYSSMIPIIEKFLFKKLQRLQMSSPIDEIANYLLLDPTFFSLDSIAKQACLSSKQFYRKFVERIGLTPKFYNRIVRFNQAYYYKISHPKTPWTSIAHEFFYTDYHHLEKEFKEFTGLTPNNWILENQVAPERILHRR